MRKIAATLAAALMIGALTSCADAPTGVAPATAATSADLLGLGGVSLTTTALERTKVLPSDVTVRAVIDGRGGTLAIPEAGLRVVVPAGAVSGPVEFTATAIAGRAVAYEFAPHGIAFAKPLQVTQELRGTNWIGLPLLDFRAVYFEDRSQVDPLKALIQVDEVLPLSIDLLRLQARFRVDHFSGYGVSTGRVRTAEQ